MVKDCTENTGYFVNWHHCTKELEMPYLACIAASLIITLNKMTIQESEQINA